jgi:hypothetical protein
MKVASLSDLNYQLYLACRKENLLDLSKDWSKLLTDYAILCDFYSDLKEAKGSILALSFELDRRGERAKACPALVSGSAAYIILFCSKYFCQTPNLRQAIIIHELGHFYVYCKGLLAQLRKLMESIYPMFPQFTKPVMTTYQKLPDELKEWLKNSLFGSYVLDVLKIPGEIFANLWVKDNFDGMFYQILESQFIDYKLVPERQEKILGTFCGRALTKYSMFSLILRLDGLEMLVEDDYRKLKRVMEELREFRQVCWKMLRESANNGEFEIFRSFEKRIMEASCSLRNANTLLPSIFREFVENVPLRLEGFH